MKAGKGTPYGGETNPALDYLFHLDALPERLTFNSRLEITGWLFHRAGQPIHGLRAVLKPRARSTRTYKGRRKRARPAIGAAYPHLPEAAMSGFLVEIHDLPFGSFDLALELRDHNKIWRPIFRTRAAAIPLGFVRQIRFPKFEQTLRTRLQRYFPRQTPNLALEAGEAEEIRREIARSMTAAARAAILTPRSLAVRHVHLFVTSKSNLFIREIGELVCAGFNDAGVAAELFVDRIPEANPAPDTIQIVVTPHEFYNLFLTPILPEEQVRLLSRSSFLLGTEQPDSDWFHSNLVIAPHAHAMLDINSLGVAGYRARGLHCFHLPLGYHSILESCKSTRDAVRDLDVCLLASITERREKFLAAHADFFAQRNCYLRLVPLGFAKTETTRSYLPEEERNELLQRSKILLNIHYSELRYFEWHRMLVGLANGCCIITETCEGFAPLVPGKHFVMVEPENLVSCCEYYLAHPEAYEVVARAGRDFVRQNLTQANNCRELLRQISAGREEPLSREANPGANLPESGIAADRSHPLWEAFRDDLRGLFQPALRASIVDPESEAKTLATIEERRRGFVERFTQQEEMMRQKGEAWRIFENEPFRLLAAPEVSILITLYNYERYIRACVESIETAESALITGGLEIVIVNDGSTDRSLDHAKEAQLRSSLPIRIVEKKFNTGLADARNVGLRLARAPYVFIMDADNLIFPRALAQLHRRIVSTGAAAAYSILCRFTNRPNDRPGLLSYFDWDPRMLVEHPYIDAMALFDRRQLLALGGYDNDLFKVGWFGWEDYELWLRMAAAHLPVAFLPNILCLYRHHESAMSNTTNLFEIYLVRHLIARYQPLLDEYPPKRQIFGVERERLGR